MPADDHGVYVISVAAELGGVHPQTLRAYERRGLLSPTRTEGGTRRYSAADIERLQRIGELTSAGLNLEGVRRVLELEEEVGCLSRKLNRLAPSAGPDLRWVQRHLDGREDVKAFMQLPGSEQVSGR